MGTFLRQIGEVYISDSQWAAYSQRLLLLLREGGMMRYESVKIFGKKIILLDFPEPDESNSFWFNYNYYENDFWEDAGMHHGHLFSGKVGYRQFCRVMAAAYILEERSSESPCFADFREAEIPHYFPLGWIKALIGEEVSLETPSLWDTYVFLKNTGNYDKSAESWNNILTRNARSFQDYKDVLAIMAAERGIEEVQEAVRQYYDNKHSDEKNESPTLFTQLKELRKEVSELPKQLPGIEEEQLQAIIAHLAEPDKDMFFAKLKEEAPRSKALQHLPILGICELPRQIIVKAVAETYHRDFWELWAKVKAGYAYQISRDIAEGLQKPVEPIPTDTYLHTSPDDRLFCLSPEEIVTLAPSTRAWLDNLKIRFRETLSMQSNWADALSFQRSMMKSLSEVSKRNAGIYAFQTMFYEFLANWAQPTYQAMWRLFEDMATDEEVSSVHLRQYLGLLSNIPLRKAIFGA